VSHHPKHPDKELRALCDVLVARGWTITHRKRAPYFKALCPCPEKHLTMIHMTPDRYYLDHKLQWLNNHVSCWKAGGDE
jgi:hypothetical protein